LNSDHLKFLRCPKCKGEFKLVEAKITERRVESGKLNCHICIKDYPIVRFIPRLVNSMDNYADDFGFQWNLHFRTQYDSYSGLNISEDRFFRESGWGRDLKSELLLEAGSGSGRFTEHAVSTGALVVSFDYSNAVEANYRNNGHYENLLIVQASIFEMPFPKEIFDKVICIGVVQHTPDPKKAFEALTTMLKSGGELVVDAYENLPGIKKYFETKYWVRPITKKLSNKTLYRFCVFWVNLLWPLCKLSYKITGRRTLSWFLLVADYRGVYPLSDELLKEWSILDTFDMLAPEYDYPQTILSVRGWYDELNYFDVDVKRGFNGIQGFGKKV